MKRVNVLLADGFEEVEALTVVDLLRRAKVYVDTVSILWKIIRCADLTGSMSRRRICLRK